MNLVRRLIRYYRPPKTIIWGVRVPKNIKEEWSTLAMLMKVPTNRLIMYVLNDWVKHNLDVLKDRDARDQLADRVSKYYLKNSLN